MYKICHSLTNRFTIFNTILFLSFGYGPKITSIIFCQNKLASSTLILGINIQELPEVVEYRSYFVQDNAALNFLLQKNNDLTRDFLRIFLFQILNILKQQFLRYSNTLCWLINTHCESCERNSDYFFGLLIKIIITLTIPVIPVLLQTLVKQFSIHFV